MLHRFLHNKTAVGTVTIVLIVAFMGLFAPFIAPHDPYATNILNKFAHLINTFARITFCTLMPSSATTAKTMI